MATFSRRQVFLQALDIIWRKKYLWMLGFFAGLISHGGEPDLFFRNTNSFSWLRDNLTALRDIVHTGQADQFFQAIKFFLTTYPANTAAYVGLFFLVVAILLWVIVLSQAALVQIVSRSAQKKNTGLIDGLATGSERFWPLIITNVITRLFTWALWIIFAGVPAIFYFTTGQPAWIITFGIGSLLVTIPVSIIVSFLTKYAIVAIVVEKMAPIDAFRRAWKLFRDNWLVSLELGFLIYLINLAAIVVVAGVTLLFFQTVSSFGEFYALLFVLALALSWTSSFSYAAWTIIYQKLLEGKQESRIGAWTSRLTNFIEPKQTPS